MEKFVGTKEASALTGYSQNYISALCRKKLIQGAIQDAKGSPWRIPITSLQNSMRKKD